MLSTIELIQLEDLAAELAKKNTAAVPPEDDPYYDWRREISEDLYETDFGL